jgi:transketolase
LIPLAPSSFDTQFLAKKIRRHVVEMTHLGNSSHVGSCLSVADILAVLYGCILKYDAKTPKHPDRDRFILSKGHAGAAVYASLAECGFFSSEKLKSHYKNGSIFSGHVSHKGVPGVELSTGSLGHGLGVGVGMALARKKNNVFVVLSDGECDEGSNWEAILFSAHHKLGNLIAVVDYNGIQSLSSTSDTLELEPFADKWVSFGWHVLEANGHDHVELKKSFELAKKEESRPSVVICHTTKGKGISFMENSVLWHYRSPQGEEYWKAIQELDDHCER